MELKISKLNKSFPKWSWTKFQWESTHILKDMSFTVSSGSFHGFIGPNGAGKTTTIQAMLGIITKNSGEILINNKKITQGSLNKIMAYIPHEVAFPKHLNGLEFIMAMAKMYGLDLFSQEWNKNEEYEKLSSLKFEELKTIIKSKEYESMARFNISLQKIKTLQEGIVEVKKDLSKNKTQENFYQKKLNVITKRLERELEISSLLKEKYNLRINKVFLEEDKELLIKFIISTKYRMYISNPKISLEAKVKNMFKEYGIEHAMYKNPNTYSSGMKKKILLIHALINNAKIFILDEPAANLDPDARIELFDTLFKLKEKGKTIFICSHILKELEGIVDEVTIIGEGYVKFNKKVPKTVDMTQLYKTVVGKDYDEGSLTLPTANKNLTSNAKDQNENLQRVVKILEDKNQILEKENKEIKKELDKLLKNK